MNHYIIIRGPLGSGKSIMASKLQNILNAKLFAVDKILDENNLTTDTEDGYISQKSFLKVNEIISREANKFLEAGTTVIFDGNFYWQSQINDLIKRLLFPHIVFTLEAPLDICIQRDLHRDKTHGIDAVTAVYNKSTEFNYGIGVDTTQSIDKCLKKILSLLPRQ